MDRRALEVSGAVCRGLERIGKHNKVFLLLWIALERRGEVRCCKQRLATIKFFCAKERRCEAL